MWLGLGLRCCQDLGAHRRRPELSDRNSYQHEQLKRAFWFVIPFFLSGPWFLRNRTGVLSHWTDTWLRYSEEHHHSETPSKPRHFSLWFRYSYEQLRHRVPSWMRRWILDGSYFTHATASWDETIFIMLLQPPTLVNWHNGIGTQTQ